MEPFTQWLTENTASWTNRLRTVVRTFLISCLFLHDACPVIFKIAQPQLREIFYQLHCLNIWFQKVQIGHRTIWATARRNWQVPGKAQRHFQQCLYRKDPRIPNICEVLYEDNSTALEHFNLSSVIKDSVSLKAVKVKWFPPTHLGRFHTLVRLCSGANHLMSFPLVPVSFHTEKKLKCVKVHHYRLCENVLSAYWSGVSAAGTVKVNTRRRCCVVDDCTFLWYGDNYTVNPGWWLFITSLHSHSIRMEIESPIFKGVGVVP